MHRSEKWEPNRSWLFVGLPKHGKSTAADTFVDALLEDQPTAIALIHDPWRKRGGANPGYRGTVFPSVAAFREAKELPRRCVFTVADPAELAALAIEIGDRVPIVLALDELDLAIKPGGIFCDEKRDEHGNFYKIVNYGRQHQVALVGTARRAARVGTDVPGLCEGMFVFRLRGQRDLKWCRDVTDDETAELVKGLPQFEGVYYDLEPHRFRVEPGTILFTDGDGRKS